MLNKNTFSITQIQIKRRAIQEYGSNLNQFGLIHSASVIVLTLTALFSLNGVTSSAQAAQTLVLRRGQQSESIDLADLKTLVGTGTTPRNIDDVGRILSPKERRQITNALQAKYNLNAVEVRNFLNTQFGNELAKALAAVTPRADKVGVQAMKTALVLGANAPEGLSLISFLEAYPRPRIELNLDEAFEVVENFNGAFWQTQSFMAAIAPQLVRSSFQIDLPFDATLPGSATVQVFSLNLKNAQRDREIPLDIYWSTSASTIKPLIVFSHGLGSVRTDMRYLAEHLASHGYIVAALEHPGSNGTHIRNALKLKVPLLEAEEFLNRPKDISFVLDELTTLNQSASSPLQGKLNSDRVMVVGYSLGASTALSIAGAELQLTQLKQRCPEDILVFSLGEAAQCFARGLPEERYQLRDSRVKAAIAFSPTTSLLFGETGLSQVAVPTLMLAESADKTTPALTEQIIGFDQIPSPKWLVGVVGGTHLSVKDPSTTTDQAGQPNTLYTGGEVVGEQAVDVRNYVKAIALAMAAQLTDEASQYSFFLTSEYAQFASTKALPIHLVTEIPPEAEMIIQEFRQR